MCGIVGYLGNEPVYEKIVKGLSRLEYRGYDSAGMAYIENGEIVVKKCKGKVVDLENVVGAQSLFRTLELDTRVGQLTVFLTM